MYTSKEVIRFFFPIIMLCDLPQCWERRRHWRWRSWWCRNWLVTSRCWCVDNSGRRCRWWCDNNTIQTESTCLYTIATNINTCNCWIPIFIAVIISPGLYFVWVFSYPWTRLRIIWVHNHRKFVIWIIFARTEVTSELASSSYMA